MITVSNTHVTARVRQPGSLDPFRERRFQFMLRDGNTPRQDMLEARRILRQIGYEVKGEPTVHREV